MSDDLVTEARRLATDKVTLIEDLKAAQDAVTSVQAARKHLQKIELPDNLRTHQQHLLDEYDALITAAKNHAAERRTAARASWSQADLQRLGLARPRKSSARTKSAPVSADPEMQSATTSVADDHEAGQDGLHE